MAVVTGNNVRVYKGGTAVAFATTCTLDISAEFIELAPTNLNDAEWRRVLPRRAQGNVSVSALYAEDTSSVEFSDVFDDLSAQTVIELAVQAQGFEYAGSGYVESLSLNAPTAQIASWSASFIFSGEITKTAI